MLPKSAYIEQPLEFQRLNNSTYVKNASKIEVATQEQSLCELWHDLRYDRLMASLDVLCLERHCQVMLF